MRRTDHPVQRSRTVFETGLCIVTGQSQRIRRASLKISAIMSSCELYA
jgi:hypothetical protein